MMPSSMKFVSAVKAFTPRPVKNLLKRFRDFALWNPHQVIAYSQEGEDLILNRIFGTQNTGFYVDVGANHPQRYSNTYLFYQRGWRGINIDAMPGSMELFKKLRPRDINLEVAILKETGNKTFFQFNEPALSTFSKELAKRRDGHNGFKIIRTIEMNSLPLWQILDDYLSVKQQGEIDFLSVDVEGLDHDVLESNDWSRFRPKVVLLELSAGQLDIASSDPVFQLMRKNHYKLFAKSLLTFFFMSEEYIRQLNSAGP
ncbi:MAG: FkbM family methyltransferase [Methanosarcinaceae archaeon]|nr:FkbM family methyltransferase [Methanosarcinaceae archaeon]